MPQIYNDAFNALAINANGESAMIRQIGNLSFVDV